MALAVWAAVAVVLAIWWIRRASVVPIAMVAAYVLVPFVMGSSITDGSGHPGTIIAFVALAFCVLARPRQLFGELGSHPLLYLAMLALLGFLFVCLRFAANGATVPTDTVLAPWVMLVLIRTSMAWGDVRSPLRNAVILLALAQIAIAFATWIAGAPFLFVDQFAAYYWFTSDYTRGMGTTDHPLVLSLLLACTVPLLVTLRSGLLQFVLFAAIIGGIMLTESRTGLIAALIGGAFIVLRKGRTVGARVTAAAGGAVAAILVFQGPLATNVFEKFADDGGSSSVRFAAMEAFGRRVGEFAIVGWGPGGSAEFQRQEGLRSSLESAGLMYSVDYGVLFSVGYFALALAFIFLGRNALGGARFAALTALVMVQTFSSLATNSASAAILWAFVALASLAAPAVANAEDHETNAHLPEPAHRAA
ncbi:O-antigen ligase family protein [Microbacterium sp. NPDC055455]